MFLQKKKFIECKDKAFTALQFISSMTASYFAVKVFESNVSSDMLSISKDDSVDNFVASVVSISIMSTAYLISSFIIEALLARLDSNCCEKSPNSINSEQVKAPNPYGSSPYFAESWKLGGMRIGNDSFDTHLLDNMSSI